MTRSEPSGGKREQQVRTAMLGIERYLEQYPNASDTLQGVREWWLAAAPMAADVVQTALDRLVEAGGIDVKTVPGGSVIYGRRRGREGESDR